ncbi:MAG: alpha/beta hydrolase [Pseudomonadota bacterium]
MTAFKVIRPILRLAAIVAVFYIAAASLMYVFQRDLLFRSSGVLTGPQEHGLDNVYAETVAMRDGTSVTVWRSSPSDEAAPTVLYFHGNGGNLAGRARRFQSIIDNGFGLYAPTYRGYPGAGGQPSEAAIVSDALEHFDRASENSSAIVVHGESLGTGVAVAVAAERDARAVVLEAPYTAALDIAAQAYPWLPVSLLMRDPFLSRSRIGDVDEPLLIVHGSADATIPLSHGQALYDIANEPKHLVVYEGAGHTQLWSFGLLDTAVEFLDSAAFPAGSR